ncbi:MAG: CopG family transcriptional regulator [Nitrospinae bacterium]|nr:CopG family transcriptional regulator [Nitrospinota bacterium]
MKRQTAAKKIRYTDVALDLELIRDFLPPPAKLVMKENTVKVTMNLTKKSVDFFKRHARRHHVSYQAMIKKALDLYASRYI